MLEYAFGLHPLGSVPITYSVEGDIAVFRVNDTYRFMTLPLWFTCTVLNVPFCTSVGVTVLVLMP